MTHEEAYAAAIPDCCSRRTLQEHIDMMLCWGLVVAIEKGEPMDCSRCELRLPDHVPESP